MSSELVTKAELLDKVSARAGVTKAVASSVVNALGDVITEEVSAGKKVPVQGVGRIAKRHKSARTARNPATNKVVNVPAKFVPSMAWSSAFKDAVNT